MFNFNKMPISINNENSFFYFNNDLNNTEIFCNKKDRIFCIQNEKKFLINDEDFNIIKEKSVNIINQIVDNFFERFDQNIFKKNVFLSNDFEEKQGQLLNILISPIDRQLSSQSNLTEEEIFNKNDLLKKYKLYGQNLNSDIYQQDNDVLYKDLLVVKLELFDLYLSEKINNKEINLSKKYIYLKEVFHQKFNLITKEIDYLEKKIPIFCEYLNLKNELVNLILANPRYLEVVNNNVLNFKDGCTEYIKNTFNNLLEKTKLKKNSEEFVDLASEYNLPKNCSEKDLELILSELKKSSNELIIPVLSIVNQLLISSIPDFKDLLNKQLVYFRFLHDYCYVTKKEGIFNIVDDLSAGIKENFIENVKNCLVSLGFEVYSFHFDKELNFAKNTMLEKIVKSVIIQTFNINYNDIYQKLNIFNPEKQEIIHYIIREENERKLFIEKNCLIKYNLKNFIPEENNVNFNKYIVVNIKDLFCLCESIFISNKLSDIENERLIYGLRFINHIENYKIDKDLFGYITKGRMRDLINIIFSTSELNNFEKDTMNNLCNKLNFYFNANDFCNVKNTIANFIDFLNDTLNEECNRDNSELKKIKEALISGYKSLDDFNFTRDILISVILSCDEMYYKWNIFNLPVNIANKVNNMVDFILDLHKKYEDKLKENNLNIGQLTKDHLEIIDQMKNNISDLSADFDQINDLEVSKFVNDSEVDKFADELVHDNFLLSSITKLFTSFVQKVV